MVDNAATCSCRLSYNYVSRFSGYIFDLIQGCDAEALCFPHCEMLYLWTLVFNCLFCAFAYSVCYENKIIIIDGETEILPRTLSYMTFV